MKYLFFCLLFICHSYSSFAQVYELDSIWVEDPLCKPEIWQKLILEPRNNELWTLYVGKENEKMSIEELETIAMWKQELMLREMGQTELDKYSCFTGNHKDYYISNEEFNDIMQQIEKAKKEKLNTKPKTKNKTTKQK